MLDIVVDLLRKALVRRSDGFSGINYALPRELENPIIKASIRSVLLGVTKYEYSSRGVPAYPSAAPLSNWGRVASLRRPCAYVSSTRRRSCRRNRKH